DHPMEYVLERDPSKTIRMVRQLEEADSRVTNPLSEPCSLNTLANLIQKPDKELVNWVSTWGLLGFRPKRVIPGDDRWELLPGEGSTHGPGFRMLPTSEPLVLIREAAWAARATTALFDALHLPTAHERVAKLKTLVTIDACNRIADQQKMSVCGVP